MDDVQHYRRDAKQFNERLVLLAHTVNTLALAVLGTAILVPVIETRTVAAALTGSNFVIAVWCCIFHLIGHVIVGWCKPEDA